MQSVTITPLEEPQEQYRGRLLRITTQRMQLPTGKILAFERAERAPGVRVLVVRGSKLLITKEWRSEISAWDYRLPGGKVFDSLNDYLRGQAEGDEALRRSAHLAAQKELYEETSLSFPIESFQFFHHSVCGATVLWDLFFFLVVDQRGSAEEMILHTTSEGEQIHPQWISRQDVQRLCLTGEIKEDRTVAVLMRFLATEEPLNVSESIAYVI